MIILMLFTIAIFLTIIVSKVQFMEFKINSLVLFIWLLVIMYLTLVFSSPYILLSIFSSVIILKLLVKANMWGTLVKYSLYFSTFIFLFNIVLGSNGETLIIEWYFIKITYEAIIFSSAMVLRLLIIMGAFAIFNSNVGMEELIDILEKLKMPSKSIITLSLSLRFFPIMLDEVRDSVNALKLKGLPITSGNLKNRIRARYPAMASMLNISMERAIQIGEALEMKGYPSNNRVAWKKIKVNTYQISSIAILGITLIVATIYIVIYGTFNFYPKLSEGCLHPYICLLMLLLPLSVVMGRMSAYD